MKFMRVGRGSSAEICRARSGRCQHPNHDLRRQRRPDAHQRRAWSTTCLNTLQADKRQAGRRVRYRLAKRGVDAGTDDPRRYRRPGSAPSPGTPPASRPAAGCPATAVPKKHEQQLDQERRVPDQLDIGGDRAFKQPTALALRVHPRAGDAQGHARHRAERDQFDRDRRLPLISTGVYSNDRGKWHW